MTGEFVTAGHLGGYVAGGDPASQYPTLWQWAVQVGNAKRVFDVGCGDGQAIEAFRAFGAEWVVGIDGVPQDNIRVYQHDFAEGPWNDRAQFDLVWSCEFVEHVEAKYLPNVVDALTRGDRLMMTHALPGQPGWHHVNCQPAEYWIAVLAGEGFEFDQQLTDFTRELAAHNEHPDNYYVKSGLVFNDADDKRRQRRKEMTC